MFFMKQYIPTVLPFQPHNFRFFFSVYYKNLKVFKNEGLIAK